MAPRKRKGKSANRKAATKPKVPKLGTESPDRVPVEDNIIKYDCQTCVEIEKIRYVWKINHFQSFHSHFVKTMDSPIFESKSKKVTKWKLRLKTQCGEGNRNIGLFLVLQDRYEEHGTLSKFTFSVLDANEDEKVSKTYEHIFIRNYDESEYGDASFVTRAFLFKESNHMLPNDQMTITCDLEFISHKSVKNSVKNNLNDIHIPECNVAQDLGYLLTNDCYSDVTLSVDGKEFPVHKAILTARSSVFAAMFRNNMKESSSNRVEITDIDKNILEELLRYIYTGKVDNLKDVVYDLLAAANKYDLERLKNICEEDLFKRLRVENAVEILLCSDTHNLEQLKKRTIEFINASLSDVMETSAWNDVISSRSGLVNEIFSALATSRKPDTE